MKNIISLIPARFVRELRTDLGASAVLALKKNDKIATGKTAQSIRTEAEVTDKGIEISVYAGGGMEYIIKGKPANTKLPVRKVGNRFELFQDIKDWKAVRGFRGSDFVLARAIAANKQDPIDIPGETLEIFNEFYGDKFNSQLLAFYAELLGQEVKKIE